MRLLCKEDRGHSYMESDKDMGSVSKLSKKIIETPDEWIEELKKCREKPSPFELPNVEQDMFKNYSNFLELLYPRTCPIPTQPVREIMFTTAGVSYRNNFNGPFVPVSFEVRKKSSVQPRELLPLYNGSLKISDEKLKDLKSLKPFVSSKGNNYIDSLSSDSTVKESFHEILEDSTYLDDEFV